MRNIKLSSHFHDRIMQRFGIELSPEEQNDLITQASHVLSECPMQKAEDTFELDVVVRGNSFCALYVSGVIVTAYKARRNRRLNIIARNTWFNYNWTKENRGGIRRRIGRKRNY